LDWNQSGQTSTEKFETKREADSDMIVLKSNQTSKKTAKSGFAKSNIANFGSESEAASALAAGVNSVTGSIENKADTKTEAHKDIDSSILTLKLDDTKSQPMESIGEIKSAMVISKPTEEQKEESKIEKTECKIDLSKTEDKKDSKDPSPNSSNKPPLVVSGTLKDLFTIQGFLYFKL